MQFSIYDIVMRALIRLPIVTYNMSCQIVLFIINQNLTMNMVWRRARKAHADSNMSFLRVLDTRLSWLFFMEVVVAFSMQMRGAYHPYQLAIE